MVKHLSCLMTRFFTRERFGRPQFLAGLLLLAFLAQASWLVKSQWQSRNKTGVEESEGERIAAGWRQWHGHSIAGAPYPDPQLDPHGDSVTQWSEISNIKDGYDTE